MIPNDIEVWNLFSGSFVAQISIENVARNHVNSNKLVRKSGKIPTFSYFSALKFLFFSYFLFR